jgi:maleylacetoacetate isomerase
MKLYGYFRSSAAFRVRIAFNLKGVESETALVNLQAGDQFSDAFRAVNPQGRVPALTLDDGTVLVQSMAIMEYLEETIPDPPLLPKGAVARARVRGLANVVACDIHPLNNLAVLNYLTGEMKVSEENKLRWYRHWVAEGLSAMEAMVAGSAETGRYCHGDLPGLADICLVPQVFNAQRFDCDLGGYPTLMRIFDACMALDAFDAAQPGRQPEAASVR